MPRWRFYLIGIILVYFHVTFCNLLLRRLLIHWKLMLCKLSVEHSMMQGKISIAGKRLIHVYQIGPEKSA
ncbi:hypothetical protein Pint_35123 [Pistacia integerrima]|uniref:Uncharacterized protein n=1 Tax=Pistacia integerrima TaxID=434235 RepID=A0ACC0Y1L4_9ROSI|nr:hypothetical protein Pint_35123 [Pistacia integerrima]